MGMKHMKRGTVVYLEAYEPDSGMPADAMKMRVTGYSGSARVYCLEHVASAVGAVSPPATIDSRGTWCVRDGVSYHARLAWGAREFEAWGPKWARWKLVGL